MNRFHSSSNYAPHIWGLLADAQRHSNSW